MKIKCLYGTIEFALLATLARRRPNIQDIIVASARQIPFIGRPFQTTNFLKKERHKKIHQNKKKNWNLLAKGMIPDFYSIACIFCYKYL